MSLNKGLKHKPFSSLRDAVRVVDAPAPKAEPTPAVGAPLGQVIVREELDSTSGAVITRVIGVPNEHRAPLGKRWRDGLGHSVLVEGRDPLVMTDNCEGIAALLRDARAGEVKIVRRQAPADLLQADEPRGTLRAYIRRGLRVAIVQKADQETGALTEASCATSLRARPSTREASRCASSRGRSGWCAESCRVDGGGYPSRPCATPSTGPGSAPRTTPSIGSAAIAVGAGHSSVGGHGDPWRSDANWSPSMARG